MHRQTNLPVGTRAKTKYDKCICTLLLFTIFPPDGLVALFNEFTWTYMRIIGFIFILILSLRTIRFVNRSCYIYALFYIDICFSTAINRREMIPAVILIGKMFSFLILFNFYARTKKLRYLIRTMKTYFGIVVFITVCIQYISKDIFGYTAARNSINFIASDNFLGYYYIPFILIVYLADIGRSRRYRVIDLYFWIMICELSLIRAWSATCLVIFSLFILMVIIRKWKVLGALTPVTSLIANAGINILIVGVQIEKYFGWLVEDILQKSSSMSARIYIWAAAIKNFLKKPIFGYGTAEDGRLGINSYIYRMRHYTHFSHNVFLEILIQGGIVAMVFFTLIYIGAHKQVTGIKGNTEIRTMIYISIFTILLMQFSEFAIYIPIANLPLILCYFYKDLIEEGIEGTLNTK